MDYFMISIKDNEEGDVNEFIFTGDSKVTLRVQSNNPNDWDVMISCAVVDNTPLKNTLDSFNRSTVSNIAVYKGSVELDSERKVSNILTKILMFESPECIQNKYISVAYTVNTTIVEETGKMTCTESIRFKYP